MKKVLYGIWLAVITLLAFVMLAVFCGMLFDGEFVFDTIEKLGLLFENFTGVASAGFSLWA